MQMVGRRKRRPVRALGVPAPPFRANATYHGDPSVKLKILENKLRHGKTMCAYDLKTDKLLWSYTATPNLIDCRGRGSLAGGYASFPKTPSSHKPNKTATMNRWSACISSVWMAGLEG